METFEFLSSTCSFFDQVIAGKFLTSINFPFPMDFITEVMNTDCMEKKPLLKLKCKKSNDKFIIVNKSSDMTSYLVLSQMSLLSLDMIRELDLVPDHIWLLSQREVMDYYRNFDVGLLRQISR